MNINLLDTLYRSEMRSKTVTHYASDLIWWMGGDLQGILICKSVHVVPEVRSKTVTHYLVWRWMGGGSARNINM